MTDQYVDAAKDNMNLIERLLKGLPGIRGYVDKELRRDADKQLRELIAGQLEEQKQTLLTVQQRLLKGGGLLLLDEVDSVIQKLQNLIDRIKTASYGYAGLFDPVRIRKEQLNALYNFDSALAGRVVEVQTAVNGLQTAVERNEGIQAQIDQLTRLITDMHLMFNRRHEAIVTPDLLTEPGYAPDVDPNFVLIESEKEK
jgi:hypothetical protein